MHTPGPWEASDTCDAIFSNRKDGSFVAQVSLELPIDEQRANARLIAASPELLAALHGVLKLIAGGQLRRNTSDDANPDWAIRQLPFLMALKAATEAIEKAEGVVPSST